MMVSEEKKYICIREKQIGKHESEITELKARADFKEQRIDELNQNMHDIDEKFERTMNDMDKKLDQINLSIQELKLESAKDDFNIDNRVKALESKLETLKWIFGVALTILSVLVALIGVSINFLH